jgi:hypothetical protein
MKMKIDIEKEENAINEKIIMKATGYFFSTDYIIYFYAQLCTGKSYGRILTCCRIIESQFFTVVFFDRGWNRWPFEGPFGLSVN